MNEQEKVRMLELFSDRAIFGLDEAELAELAELEKNFPELQDASAQLSHSLEFSATAISLANLDTSEAMPAHLRAKIVTDSEKYFTSSEETVANTESPATEEEFQPTFAFQPKRSMFGWLGWAFATAFFVVLAVNIWTSRLQPVEMVENPPKIQTPTPEPSAAQKREQILASANKIQLNLAQPKPDAVNVITGDVVWDNAKQEGYVRFQGLPVNDASKETYQLWIADENQKNPVDGGVFDVNEKGEIIIPIKAKLKVVKPTMFAVTKEKPGGVVVSDLGEKLIALAKV